MKTKSMIRKLLLVPVLLAWCSTSAQAFYDASVGRWLNRDPIGEAGAINLYAFVENAPIARSDFFGLAAVAAPPKFDPDNTRWNGNENCYSYACNRPRPNRDPMKRQPGGQLCGGDCAKVIAGAKKDGLIDTNPDGSCPGGMHKVYAVAGTDIAGQGDYHWYRQDEDGGWSHKRGWDGNPERNDGSGAAITDPASANHDYRKARPRGGDYNKPCGFLCAPN